MPDLAKNTEALILKNRMRYDRKTFSKLYFPVN